MPTEKDSIRQRAKQFRDRLEISPDWAEQAADIFFESVPVSSETVLSVYYPIGKELDPSPAVERAWAKGITVCLPVIRSDDRRLDFVPWTRQTVLRKKDFGVTEPEDTSVTIDPDILLIPLLAFDQTGNRMGYGRGHYDATLAALRAKKNVTAVGFAYAEQAVLLPLPAEPHDQKLDMVVTPAKIFDFRR